VYVFALHILLYMYIVFAGWICSMSSFMADSGLFYTVTGTSHWWYQEGYTAKTALVFRIIKRSTLTWAHAWLSPWLDMHHIKMRFSVQDILIKVTPFIWQVVVCHRTVTWCVVFQVCLVTTQHCADVPFTWNSTSAQLNIAAWLLWKVHIFAAAL